jgi:hypothetical protein
MGSGDASGHERELERIGELVRLDRCKRLVAAVGALLLGGQDDLVDELVAAIPALRLGSPSEAMSACLDAAAELTSASRNRQPVGTSAALHVDVVHGALADEPKTLAELCAHSGKPPDAVADSLAPLLCSGAVAVNDRGAFVLAYR